MHWILKSEPTDYHELDNLVEVTERVKEQEHESTVYGSVLYYKGNFILLFYFYLFIF